MLAGCEQVPGDEAFDGEAGTPAGVRVVCGAGLSGPFDGRGA